MSVYEYVRLFCVLGALAIFLLFTLTVLLILKLKKKKMTTLKTTVIFSVGYSILWISFGIALSNFSIFKQYYFSAQDAVSAEHGGYKIIEIIPTESEMIILTSEMEPDSQIMLAMYETHTFYGREMYIYRGAEGVASRLVHIDYTKAWYQPIICGAVSPEKKDELLTKDKRIKTKIVEYQEQEYIFWYVENVPEEEVEQWFEL